MLSFAADSMDTTQYTAFFDFSSMQEYDRAMQHNKTYAILTGIVIAIIALFFIHRHAQQPASSSIVQEGMIGALQKGTGPWPVESAHLRARLATLGLPALTQEGTTLHIHQHLDMLINGQTVPVPAMIGIDRNNQFISPLHVHDTSGVIHVESPTVQSFTLGQFFDVWGLTFSSQCIGGDCADPTNTLRVYINGVLAQGDPRAIVLAAHQEMFIFYGTAAQVPKTIPATFAFPAGE
jgi:hypothetical protein